MGKAQNAGRPRKDTPVAGEHRRPPTLSFPGVSRQPTGLSCKCQTGHPPRGTRGRWDAWAGGKGLFWRVLGGGVRESEMCVEGPFLASGNHQVGGWGAE